MAVGLQLAVSPSQPVPKGDTSQEQHYSTDLKEKETALPILFRRAELFKNHKCPLVIMSPRRALMPQGNEQSPLDTPVSPLSPEHQQTPFWALGTFLGPKACP